METKVREIQQQRRSGGPSKQEEIKVLLAKMAIRRQAKVGEMEFAVFSEDLMGYETEVIAEALNQLCSKPRAEGETAFPELATILDAVRGVIRARRPSVEQAAQQKWDEYVAKCLQEGVEPPDEETQKRIEALNAKLELKVAM